MNWTQFIIATLTGFMGVLAIHLALERLPLKTKGKAKERTGINDY